MKTDLVESTVKTLIKLRRTYCVLGAPGTAKTSIIRQTVESMLGKASYIAKHTPTMAPEDFGIPVPNSDKTEQLFIVPDWFPSYEKAMRGAIPKEGVLVFEEGPQADNAQQKILANICQERELHGHRMADGWMVCFTGNRSEDRSGANQLLRHFANRMTILNIEPDLEATLKWCLANGMKPEIGAFWRFRPNKMCDFDPKQQSNPTPRSWFEGVSPILGVVSPEAEYECISGAIGEGVASEFKGFLQIYRNLPDPDKCIANPDSFAIPKDMATVYALVGAIAYRANPDNIANIVKITQRLDPEFSVCLMRDAVRRNTAVADTKAFVEWSRQNIKVMR